MGVAAEGKEWSDLGIGCILDYLVEWKRKDHEAEEKDRLKGMWKA
jgi:hypothetical protein